MNKTFELNIDGDLLKEQKRWLYGLASSIPPNPNLEGIINLLDEITDQAHNKYGIDCLMMLLSKLLRCKSKHFTNMLVG
jgi:hypothetical protein